LRKLIAVPDRIGAELAPLQATEPGAEIIDQHPEGADEARGVRNERALQLVSGQVTAIARPGERQISVQLDPAQRAILGGQLDSFAPAGGARAILARIRIVGELRIEL